MLVQPLEINTHIHHVHQLLVELGRQVVHPDLKQQLETVLEEFLH
jgi:hypothetical protein